MTTGSSTQCDRLEIHFLIDCLDRYCRWDQSWLEEAAKAVESDSVLPAALPFFCYRFDSCSWLRIGDEVMCLDCLLV